MTIELPHGEDIFPPHIPQEVKSVSPELYDYLERLKRYLDNLSGGVYDNDAIVVDVINSGTSGTFTLSSGGSIVVTSGVVISVTS